MTRDGTVGRSDATERSLPLHWDIDPARMMRPRLADSVRASSPSGLREQAGHMTASDFCAAREANLVGPFRDGLRELGYQEGRNVVIEYRWAEGKYERFPALVAELLAVPVDLIVTAGTPATLAVKKATSTVPLVMIAVGDPVGTGIVPSLARPGGNITGLSSIAPDLEGKRLELLREVIPKLSYVAFFLNPLNPFHTVSMRQAFAAAQALGIKLQALEVRTSGELDGAFAAIAREKPDALLISGRPCLSAQSQAHDRFRYRASLAQRECVSRISRRWRVDVLWAELRGHAQTGRRLRGQDSQGRETRRSAA
jgi:hypothetical protein